VKKFLVFSFALLFCWTAWAAPKPKEIDKDGDGKTDIWEIYDAKGRLKNTARDTNKDGKPDQFIELIKGRQLIIKEQDRNFDGQIDRRALAEFKPDKKIPIYSGGKMTNIPNPGYVNLWVEEDNDFDGKIDVYKERGNKEPSKAKIGTPIHLPKKTVTAGQEEGASG
jgi:hypothetical protein